MKDKQRWRSLRLPFTAAILCIALALLGGALSASSARADNPPGANGSTEFAPDLEVDANIPNSKSAAHVPSDHVPRPTSTPVGGAAGTSFLGLNFEDQRSADNGNQFSLEPPDQALCVSDTGYVMEAVNDVLAFYDKDGMKRSGPTAANPFFFPGSHQIVRSTPPVYGIFISDPKCYFDPELQKFFFTSLSIDRDPATGAFTGPTHVEIAVSKSATPTTSHDDWFFYRINTTNAGTQPDPSTPAVSNPNCPCLGDQPLIGADRYGFYITTNEFPLFADGFNGAVVYAMDKAALAAPTTAGTIHNLTVVSNRAPLAEGPSYSIQPATSPTTDDWQPANNGTEYFLSALDFDATLDNRIAAWSLTNTASLAGTGPANVQFTNAVLPSEVYGQPPAAEQKPGPTPLADFYKEHENLLNSNDDRMQQVVYVRPSGGAGYLASGLNTVVKTENGPTHVGIAWFVVQPTQSVPVSGAITSQGYTAVNQQNVMFPAIGLNHEGKGAMVFTLVGPDYYPSATFVPFSTSGAGSPVLGGAFGNRPADGFTGYRTFGGSGVERWGDYSAAVADTHGSVWMATEYIEGDVAFPPRLANWDTRVINYTP